jgi:menaquinol-cytochrome c reductase iron-sulfur subunit
MAEHNQSRRSFLSLIPIGVFGVIFSSISVAAVRFLRPRLTASNTDRWIDIANLSDLGGDTPLTRKIRAETLTGWAKTIEERQVFVLAKSNKVLSAVCPHEGCEVFWEQGRNRFSCPCHESYFSPDGSRLTGPAPRGLDQLPSRVQDGRLQVQYESFENNSTTQVKRA